MHCATPDCARERVHQSSFCKLCEAEAIRRAPTGPVSSRSDVRWPDGQLYDGRCE